VGEIAFAGTFCALVGAGTLIALALLRRKQREKHSCEINELRRLSFPIISSLNAGTLNYQLALQAHWERFSHPVLNGRRSSSDCFSTEGTRHRFLCRSCDDWLSTLAL
jgi:hypothetical protein